MDWGNAFVRSRTYSPEGAVTAVTLELHVAGDFKKTKKKVTWLSASSAANALAPVTLIDYDYLITKKKLEEDDKVEDLVTPVTEFKDAALADSNVLKDVRPGDTVQFERKGYYICDQEKEADGRLRFILIPDGRAVGVESKAVAALQAAEKAAKAAGAEVVKKGKKAAKGAKAAVAGAVDAAQQAVAGPTDAGIKVHKSDITSGFDIPVPTNVRPPVLLALVLQWAPADPPSLALPLQMFEVKRVYGEEDLKIETPSAMHSVTPYTKL